MHPTTVIVVAEKTSLKRPLIFLCSVNMALCFFMLAVVVAAHRSLTQAEKVHFGVNALVQLFCLGGGCFLMSVLGVCGACKEKKWCLIVFAVGMAAASQAMIVDTALRYQPIYETEIVNREAALLSLMPLTEASKHNKTLLYEIQRYYKCCGLVEGYKDWGSSIPHSCLCNRQTGRTCKNLPAKTSIGAPKNQLIYQEPCLPIYMTALKRGFSFVMGFKFGIGMFWGILLVLSIKLIVQIKRKTEFLALLENQKYFHHGYP